MDLQEALLFTVLPCVDDEAELPLVLQQLRQRRLKEARAALETWLAPSLLQQRQGKEATKSSADVGSPGQKREVDVPSARPKTGARPSPRCSVTSPCSDPELEVTWTWTSTGSARRPWGGCRPAGGVELKEVTSMRNAGGRGHAECRCPSVHRFDFESEDAVVDAVEHRRSEVHVDAGVDAPGMRAQHKQLRIEGECLDHPYFPSHVFLSNRCHERTGGAGASGVQAQETCANQHCTIAQEALMRQDEEDSPNCTDAHGAKMQSHEHAAHSVQGVQVEGTPSIGTGQVVSNSASTDDGPPTFGNMSAVCCLQPLADVTPSKQRLPFHFPVPSMSAGTHGGRNDVARGVGGDIATTGQECHSDNREDAMSGPSTSNTEAGTPTVGTHNMPSKRVRLHSTPSIVEGQRCADVWYSPGHDHSASQCSEGTEGAGASGVQAQETCANQHCTIAQEALMRQDEEDSPNCTDAHAAKMQSHEHAAHSVQGVQVEGTPSIGRGQVVSTTGSISAAKGWQALQDGTFSEQRHAFHGSVQSMSAGSHGVCCDVASGVGDDIGTTSQECQSDNREDPMSGPSTSNAREGVFAIATDDVLSKRVRIYSRPSIVEGQRCVDAQYLSCGDHSASKCEGAGTSAKQQHGTGAEAASTREEDYGEEGLAEGLAPSRFRQADKPITGERPMSFDLPGLVAEEPGAEPDAMLLVPGGRGGLRHHRTSSREGGRERSLSSAPTTSPVSTAADADQVDEKAESPDGAGRATPEVLEAPVPAGEATASADLWPWPNPRAPHARRASTGAVRPRPQALELDLEAPRTGSEPRRRAGSEELWRPVASTPGRRHSGPSRVEGNVAQKVAVYEAFRKSSPRRAASEASAGSGSSGGSGRSGRGGSGGGAEEASAPGSPTERSKQWVLDCLVDAGALQVLQMGEREEAEQGQFGRETMELEPVGKTWTGSSMRSDEASTPSHPVGSPEMILKLQEQLRLQSSKFQSENEERKELELRLQQHEEALDALRHLEAQLGPKKEKEEAGVEATKEQKETEDKRKEKAEKQKAFAQKKAEEAPKEEAKKEMDEKEKKEEKSQQKGKCQDKGSKGKGKGNPPKGKGKGEGSVEPRMPEVPLKIAMKKLFWNPLKLGKTASVWERIYERYAERMQHPDFDPTTGSHFDRMELEAHFAEALGGSSPQKTRASLAPLTNHRRVLEEKRRRELWFMLALMPGSDQLLRAVAYMDDEILKPDKVELLQMNLPTAADVELIETSLMNSPLAEGETWDVPEEFALSISKIPQYATRVKMWSFLNSVGAAIARLRLAQKELFEAAKVLLTSESLEKILGLVLFVGNYLNGGTARGRADGFDLEALPKLAKLRGRGHDTLLDFLVSQAERACLVQLFEPDRELEVLRRARAHAVADAVEETKSWISQAEGFLPHEAPSEAPMRMRQEQVQKSLGELQEVLATFGEWQEKYEELCQWFQMQDVRQRPSEEFFSLWESFLSDLKRAWEGYQRAQEAKTPRRSKSLPPRRRSAPILSAPHGVQGSKTPCSSPRFAGGNCDVRYVRYPRRRTAIGSASWADPPEGLAGLTGLAEKEPA